VEDIRNHLKEGDTVKAVIINVDRKNRGINLSIKALDKADTAAAMQKFASENTSIAGTTNLGALLKAKMDSSKADAQ
jgi:small subunit ribosomal protein S1